MARERWGTFSVVDHIGDGAIVPELLLYDKVILPRISAAGPPHSRPRGRRLARHGRCPLAPARPRRRRARRLAWHTGLWEGQYSALYLKVIEGTGGERVTLILLANSDGLKWESRLDEAAIERSPFATAFLDPFPQRPTTR